MSLKRHIHDSSISSDRFRKRKKPDPVLSPPHRDDSSSPSPEPPNLESDVFVAPRTPVPQRIHATPKSRFSFAEAKRKHIDKLRSIDRVLPRGQRDLHNFEEDDYYVNLRQKHPASEPAMSRGPAYDPPNVPRSLRSPLRFASPPSFFSPQDPVTLPAQTPKSVRWTTRDWKLLYELLQDLHIDGADYHSIRHVLPDWLYLRFERFPRAEVMLRAMPIINGGLDYE